MLTVAGAPLGDAELARVDAHWRAANYLSVGQIYLMGNPLLREPLLPEHIKPRLLGHWGTAPGLNILYSHLCRVITRGESAGGNVGDARRREVLYIAGPGHGGPALLANVWLEGTYSDVYPAVSRDETGMARLFKQFSFPGGVPSHVAPETPGSIHEGGELGYSLSHAYGAALDNPNLLVACVIGDGEAETGPLAAAWHSNKFLDPVSDGAVLPILHLNGYKIANPTLLARIDDEELSALLSGYGYRPYLVSGEDPVAVHQQLAATLDAVVEEIDGIQARARMGGGADGGRPQWPMIVLRTPKGWTGPSQVDGRQVEGTWRSHQVPLSAARDDEKHLALLEEWLRSYRPEELFDDNGAPRPDVVGWLPTGDLRMGATPYANGGRLTRPLELPDYRDYAVKVITPGAPLAEPTRVVGAFLRDTMAANAPYRNFRIVGPDETESNRIGAVLEVTNKVWRAAMSDMDEHLGASGRVMEILSEHTCQGWLEGYLLTGRHGLFSCYEAFVHIVDSMVNQHAKWLKTARELPWRAPIPSLNYLLTSHVWRQDHNGFSHQDPGFIDFLVNKKGDVVRVYLPPDANTLLSVTDHCLRSRNYINVIVAGKQPAPSYLDMEAAALHCARGLGIWEWASTGHHEPDVVLACAGDIPTMEVLAAADLLRTHLPDLRVRVVNIVNLMRLQPQIEHPHGLSDAEFDAIFTPDRPIVFAYHGYPWLIHRLTYRRTGHRNLHVRGYKEEGTTTTPFDLVVRNDMDRYHLFMDVIDRVPGLALRAASVRQTMIDQRTRHQDYIRRTGEDIPEVRDWTWTAAAARTTEGR